MDDLNEPILGTYHPDYIDDTEDRETANLFYYMQRTSKPSVQEIQKFIDNGVQLNSFFQGTPLLEQALQNCPVNEHQEQEYLSIVEFYLKNGADPNIDNSALTYPLQWVDYIGNRRLHKRVIELLYTYGANPAVQNKKGETAFFDSRGASAWVYTINEINKNNAKEKMRNYLLHGCNKKDQESKKYIATKMKVTLNPAFFIFLFKTDPWYKLPRELKKYIMSYIPDDAIDYPQTVRRNLFGLSTDQLPAFIEACSQRVLRSLKALRIALPQVPSNREKRIVALLRKHYIQEGKKILAIKDCRGRMAKDSNSHFGTFLDPKNFETNFKDVLNDVLYRIF